jgi:uncharacterized SAM-binding protein YcdF (DUF218 family)
MNALPGVGGLPTLRHHFSLARSVVSLVPPPIRLRRYLSDADAWHAALVTVLALVLSGGLVFLGYLVHVWVVAWRSPLCPRQPMVVLVFGQRLERGAPGEDYRHRLERALVIARTALAERVLLLGGHSGGAISEAMAGLHWLSARGWPERVPLELEQVSTDSLENLHQARMLLKSICGSAPLPPVALLSSRYHLARCRWLAQRLGFVCVPVAAEPRLRLTPRQLRLLVLESGYLMWADLGMRWASLIGHARMAGRIG